MRSKSGKRKPWAVLAYTVADDRADSNALDASVRRELKSVCSGADFSEVSLAAQVDFKASTGVFRSVVAEAAPKIPSAGGFEDIRIGSDPLWRGIRARLEHSKLHVVRERTDLNAARASVLKDFLHFGQAECPADRYLVFFYGHGYGPLGLFFDEDADQTDRGTMPLAGIAESLRAVGGRAAVLVLRACQAGTLETAYELKDAGEFMVASQAIVPIAGVWPWGSLLTSLTPSARSGDVARSIAQQLALFLKPFANRKPLGDVPCSVIDLGEANAIVKPLRALATALNAARGQPARAAACAAAMDHARVGFPGDSSQPGDPALLDVATMCDHLQKLEGDAVTGPARALGKVVTDRLVTWQHSHHGLHRGVALYCKPVRPEHIRRSHIYDQDFEASDDRRYRKLALSKATGWDLLALNPLK